LYTNFQTLQLLESIQIGFEFEFFSPFDRSDLAQMLSNTLGKNVIALESQDTNFPLDNNTYKIEPDFSGGLKMHEFVTAPQPYNEAIHTLYKVYNFIADRGYTTNRCGVHINMSVHGNEVKESTRNLNIFKFILGLNENKIYDLWPSSEQSKMQKVFKNSISYIYPKNRFLSEKVNAASISNPMDFKIPQTKYHGINFTKLKEGYIEVRYVGGVGYQSKKKESVELINLLGEHLITVLQNNRNYTEQELMSLNDILKTQKHYLDTVRTYESFVRSYPKIKLTVNLRENSQVIQTSFKLFRESLCDLLEYTEMDEGEINFDSDRNRLQVKYASIRSKFILEKIDFVWCRIESELSECSLTDCRVKGAFIKNSELFENNNVKYSLLEDCSFHDSCSNQISYTYLKNQNLTSVNGILTECIINRGIISTNSRVDNKTELISVNKDSSDLKK